jgi:hypothetical protein
VNKAGAGGLNRQAYDKDRFLLWVVVSCSLPFAQLVNNTYVKTSSLSQRLAVANLADAFCAGSICAPGHELLPEISLLDLQKVRRSYARLRARNSALIWLSW